MAFTTKPDFAFKHASQIDTPVFATTADLKTALDSQVVELRSYINSVLIPELEASTSAASLGAVVGGVASKLQTFIDAVEAAGSGTTPGNDIVTNAMLNPANKTGLLADYTGTIKTSLIAICNELLGLIGTSDGNLVTHQASSDHDGRYYTKTVADTLILLKTLIDAQGDIIVGSADDTPAKLTLGTTGKVLQSNGTTVIYDYPPATKYEPSATSILTSAAEVTVLLTGGGTFDSFSKTFTLKHDGKVRVAGQIKVGGGGQDLKYKVLGSISGVVTAEVTITQPTSQSYSSFSTDFTANGKSNESYVIQITGTGGQTGYLKDVVISADISIPSNSIT